MVTYFNKKDMTDFGNYLLSDERKSSILFEHDESKGLTAEEKLKTVYKEDFENFLAKKKVHD